MQPRQFTPEYQEKMDRVHEIDVEWEQLESELKRPWNADDSYMRAVITKRIADLEEEYTRLMRELEAARK